MDDFNKMFIDTEELQSEITKLENTDKGTTGTAKINKRY